MPRRTDNEEVVRDSIAINKQATMERSLATLPPKVEEPEEEVEE